MTANKQQKQRLWAAAKARGMTNDSLRELIFDATGQRTDRSSAMSGPEIEQLIADINRLGETKKNKMRRKLLALAHKLGWQVVHNGQAKADMKAVDDWCQHYGQYNKPLQEHSYKELCNLISQFEKVYASYL